MSDREIRNIVTVKQRLRKITCDRNSVRDRETRKRENSDGAVDSHSESKHKKPTSEREKGC